MKLGMIKAAVSSSHLNKRILGATGKAIATTGSPSLNSFIKKLTGGRGLRALDKAEDYDSKFNRVYQKMVALRKQGK